MDFALFSVILFCSVQITKLRHFTQIDLDFLQERNFTLIRHTNETTQCVDRLLGLHHFEIPSAYILCDPDLKPVINQPILTHCPGFDCWESQLSRETRLDIIDIMNRYREKVAKGKCQKWCEKNTHRLAFELHWNYALEKNATWLLETCTRNQFYERTFTLNNSLMERGAPAFEETVTTSFKMETGLQSELRSLLWRLMYENRLNDWDEQSQFRRGDMHDVACAFTCRRGVTFVTDLNETVENGIVGHLSCVFISTIVNVEYYGPGATDYNTYKMATDMDPTIVHCRQFETVRAEFGVGNFFPTLCTKNVSTDFVGTHEEFDSCDYRPRNMPQLCSGSGYSSLTWEEKFYGLFMASNWYLPPLPRNDTVLPFINETIIVDVTECNEPLIPSIEFPYLETFQHFYCTLTEVVLVQANTARCFGWNCADSQLTDSTRMLIVERLNYARNQVAKGECSEYCPQPCRRCNPNARYCNMVKLKWHWFLERKASEIVRNCPPRKSIRKNFIYDDEPFPVPHGTAYEEITVVFDLPYYQGQLALPETVEKLFWMNTFEDWNGHHYFRRANAQFIGCSIVSRSNTLQMPKIKPEINFYNGFPTHMVCIYATLNESFNSIIDEAYVDCCPVCPDNYNFSVSTPCWLRFVKEIDADDSLCTNTLVLNTMNCQIDERCHDDSISKAWYMQYNGNTTVQTINGSLIQIERKSFNSIGICYERAYCRFMVFFFSAQIFLWILTLRIISSIEDVHVVELLIESSISKFGFRLSDSSQKRSVEETATRETSEEMSQKTPDGAKPARGIPSKDRSQETPDGAKPARGIPSKDRSQETPDGAKPARGFSSKDRSQETPDGAKPPSKDRSQETPDGAKPARGIPSKDRSQETPDGAKPARGIPSKDRSQETPDGAKPAPGIPSKDRSQETPDGAKPAPGIPSKDRSQETPDKAKPAPGIPSKDRSQETPDKAKPAPGIPSKDESQETPDGAKPAPGIPSKDRSQETPDKAKPAPGILSKDESQETPDGAKPAPGIPSKDRSQETPDKAKPAPGTPSKDESQETPDGAKPAPGIPSKDRSQETPDGAKPAPGIPSKDESQETPDGAKPSPGIPSKDRSADAADSSDLPAKKRKKKTSPPEIRTMKRTTTTPEPYGAPTGKKTRIRAARSEDDDDLEEEEIGTDWTGPTIQIGVEQMGAAGSGPKRRPRRTARDRKSPKRAKTTAPPAQKKK